MIFSLALIYCKRCQWIIRIKLPGFCRFNLPLQSNMGSLTWNHRIYMCVRACMHAHNIWSSNVIVKKCFLYVVQEIRLVRYILRGIRCPMFVWHWSGMTVLSQLRMPQSLVISRSLQMNSMFLMCSTRWGKISGTCAEYNMENTVNGRRLQNLILWFGSM